MLCSGIRIRKGRNDNNSGGSDGVGIGIGNDGMVCNGNVSYSGTVVVLLNW